MIDPDMTDYSLTELARLADVTPRTVRYYVTQGLLPSPDAAGPATRYGDVHLARLRLIRRLQREHLPLAEIRLRLEAMTDAEIEAAAGAPGPAARVDSDTAIAYVRNLMAQSGVSPRFYARPAAPPPASAPAVSAPVPLAEAAALAAISMREVPLPDPDAAAAPSAAVRESGATYASGQPDRSTWERITLDPDVELHVRRPLDRLTNKRVDRLVRIARELFEDETT